MRALASAECFFIYATWSFGSPKCEVFIRKLLAVPLHHAVDLRLESCPGHSGHCWVDHLVPEATT